MEKQNNKNHPRLNKSRVSRYITIFLFLIFAGIAFYVTFDSSTKNVVVSDELTSNIEKEPNAQEETPLTIKPVYDYSDLEIWDKIVVNYFTGKDIQKDLTEFEKTAEKDQIINASVIELEKLISENKIYKPVEDYLSAKDKLEKILNKHQIITIHGKIGEFLNNFVKIRDKNSNFALSERVEDILFHLKRQNYESALTSLQEMKNECKCVETQEFSFLQNQQKTFMLLEQITKKIHPEKK